MSKKLAFAITLSVLAACGGEAVETGAVTPATATQATGTTTTPGNSEYCTEERIYNWETDQSNRRIGWETRVVCPKDCEQREVYNQATRAYETKIVCKEELVPQ